MKKNGVFVFQTYMYDVYMYIRGIIHFKADMNSDMYVILETAAIFFLANLYSKQGISSEYVMVDFICYGLLEL